MTEVVDSTQNCSGAAACLRRNGVDTVIRYYSEFTQIRGKQLTPEEALALGNAGLRVGAVYQDRQNRPEDFSQSRGKARGHFAYRYARDTILQPPRSAVYFSVDFDASDAEITAAVIPFFKGIAQAFNEESGGASDYRIGVYGSGLVCRRLLDDGLAELTWLAGSRGFRETRAFDEAGRWNLKQRAPEIDLCGIEVDRNDSNPLNPDTGDFTPDVELLRPPGTGPSFGQPHRVVARDGLRLRAGPGTEFGIIGSVAFGTVVSIISRTGDWGKADLQGDGAADGFMHMAFLEPVA